MRVQPKWRCLRLPAEQTDSAGSLLSRSRDLLNSVAFWWIVSLLWTATYIWSSDHIINPDGISYLDMASEVVNGRPGNLINGYWSPLYPSLLGAALLIVRPLPAYELSVVRAVNLGLYALLLLSFTFFLRSWFGSRCVRPSAGLTSSHLSLGFCFLLLLWVTTEYTPVTLVTPDLCVAAVAFAAAGLCVRVSRGESGPTGFIALGVVLGLGYYAKTAMLPIGAMLLAILFLLPPASQNGRRMVLLTMLTFCIVAAPLIVLISNRVGRLSYGETGALNYLWYVNGLTRWVGWTGDTAGPLGAATHPPRIIMMHPKIIEFASPQPGTYPLWYDPSYWYAGARPRLSIGEQLGALRDNLRIYAYGLLNMSVLCAGVVGLLLGARRPVADSHRSTWVLVVWCATCFLMYAAVHVEYRFLTAFLVLAWLGLYQLVAARSSERSITVVLATVLITLFLPATASWAASASRTIGRSGSRPAPDYVVIGDALRSAGVGPGASLAFVGPAFHHAYFARYIGARITMEVMDEDAFWNLNERDRAGVEERMIAEGIRAVVTRNPRAKEDARWNAARDVFVLSLKRN